PDCRRRSLRYERNIGSATLLPLIRLDVVFSMPRRDVALECHVRLLRTLLLLPAITRIWSWSLPSPLFMAMLFTRVIRSPSFTRMPVEPFPTTVLCATVTSYTPGPLLSCSERPRAALRTSRLLAITLPVPVVVLK